MYRVSVYPSFSEHATFVQRPPNTVPTAMTFEQRWLDVVLTSSVHWVMFVILITSLRETDLRFLFCMYCLRLRVCSLTPELQGIEDNLKIIFLISQ